MSNLENLFKRFSIYINATTEELNYDAIFDLVLNTLDNKITEQDFFTYLQNEEDVNGNSFSKNFIKKLYQEYSHLYPYLLINKLKLRLNT